MRTLFIDGRSPNGPLKRLIDMVHPDGLACPRCHEREHLHVHRHHSKSRVPDYRCSTCGKIFNLWAGTPFQGTHHTPWELDRFVREIRRGIPSAEISRLLDWDRGSLGRFRHKVEKELRHVLGPLPKKRRRH